MKNWHALLITVGCVIAIGGVVWAGVWSQAQQAKEPHCVCSQQTCFPAPDGGWRR